jgi:hypothetical protein
VLQLLSELRKPQVNVSQWDSYAINLCRFALKTTTWTDSATTFELIGELTAWLQNHVSLPTLLPHSVKGLGRKLTNVWEAFSLEHSEFWKAYTDYADVLGPMAIARVKTLVSQYSESDDDAVISQIQWILSLYYVHFLVCRLSPPLTLQALDYIFG